MASFPTLPNVASVAKYQGTMQIPVYVAPYTASASWATRNVGFEKYNPYPTYTGCGFAGSSPNLGSCLNLNVDLFTPFAKYVFGYNKANGGANSFRPYYFASAVFVPTLRNSITAPVVWQIFPAVPTTSPQSIGSSGNLYQNQSIVKGPLISPFVLAYSPTNTGQLTSPDMQPYFGANQYGVPNLTFYACAFMQSKSIIGNLFANMPTGGYGNMAYNVPILNGGYAGWNLAAYSETAGPGGMVFSLYHGNVYQIWNGPLAKILGAHNRVTLDDATLNSAYTNAFSWFHSACSDGILLISNKTTWADQTQTVCFLDYTGSKYWLIKFVPMIDSAAAMLQTTAWDVKKDPSGVFYFASTTVTPRNIYNSASVTLNFQYVTGNIPPLKLPCLPICSSAPGFKMNAL